MKVVGTGGAGFIGSHSVDLLIKSGNETVVVNDLSTGYVKNNHNKDKLYNRNIQDRGLEEVIKEKRPYYVSHQAVQKDIRLSVANPIHDAKINILCTINILQNCIKYDVKKVVFASTGSAIYGDLEIFSLPESHPVKPISPYGFTKLVAEQYL
jgi:UDP-glucose 4-epimerase